MENKSLKKAFTNLCSLVLIAATSCNQNDDNKQYSVSYFTPRQILVTEIKNYPSKGEKVSFFDSTSSGTNVDYIHLNDQYLKRNDPRFNKFMNYRLSSTNTLNGK